MSELISERRKKALKEIIRLAHQGVPVEELKARFREELGELTPLEIAQLEQQLVQEGIPREELARLCDIHISLFQNALEKVQPIAPPWHPLTILMEEHRHMLALAQEMKGIGGRLADRPDKGLLAELSEKLKLLEEADVHYLREENVLFPSLERHGITEPPAIMWLEHDHIRSLRKELRRLIAERPEGFPRRLAELATALADVFTSHFYKETKILFPTALEVVREDEWTRIREEFDEVGYFRVSPPPLPAMVDPEPAPMGGERIRLSTGDFTQEELEAVLNSLPVDITFVDAQDRVRYFNQPKGRIFLRAKAVLGRTVQNCHPPKSIHIVNRIVEDFKAGRRDVAEFWINMKGRLIYIRYFPVRNERGEYLGTIEVTQDITDIQRIKGEKRLLDDVAAGTNG